MVAAVLLRTMLSVLTGRLLYWPATNPPQPGQADAVLVLSGGGGEREAAGIRLMQAGVAPVLVVSNGGDPGSRGTELCGRRLGFRIICITPDPNSTRGEGRAFAKLAEREGWRSVALATSTYHIRRARLHLGRCFKGTIFTVRAPGSRPDGGDFSTSGLGCSAASPATRHVEAGPGRAT